MPIDVLDKDGNPQTILTLDDIADLIGEVQATPTENTQLDRLKAIADAISSAASTALPAGTNNIGDVDVASLPDTLAGPSGITSVDSYGSAAVDLAAGTANQVLVSAPGANKQIWVYGIMLKTNGTTATVVLQDEDDTALTGTITLTDSDGYVRGLSGNFEMPLYKVATNKALEADTGGSGTVDGDIQYAIVDVS